MLSFWHLTMALYYIMLVVLRINVFVRSTKALFSKDKEKAYIKLYRSTHRMLLFLDFMLIIAIFLLLENDVWKSYPRIVINLVAIYTCYKIIASVVNAAAEWFDKKYSNFDVYEDEFFDLSSEDFQIKNDVEPMIFPYEIYDELKDFDDFSKVDKDEAFKNSSCYKEGKIKIKKVIK